MKRFGFQSNVFGKSQFSLVLLTCLLVFTPSCTAAEVTADVSRSKIDEAIKRLGGNTSISDDQRAKATELYQDALNDLSASEAWKQKADKFESMLKDAPEELQKLQKELSSPPQKGAPLDIKAMSLAQLKEQKLAAQTLAEKNREDLANLVKEIDRRTARQQEVPVELEAARKELSQLESVKATDLTQDEPEVVDAHRMATQAQIQAINSEILTLTRELPAYEAQRDLLLAKKELLTRQSKIDSHHLKILNQAIDQKQRQQAIATVAEAIRVAQNVDPSLASLAKENVSLAERLAGDNGVAARLHRLDNTKQSIESDLANLHTSDATLKKQENIIGLTEAMGVLLLRYRSALPNPAQMQREILATHPPVDKVQLKLLEYKDLRNKEDFSDIPAQAQALAKRAGENLSDEKREQIVKEATTLLEARRELLDKIITTSDDYLQKLLLVETLLTTLQHETQTLHDYIEERILWTRSASLLGWSSGPEIEDDFIKLTSGPSWQETFHVLYRDIYAYPIPYSLFVLILAALIASRRRLKRGIEQTGRKTANMKNAFRQTLLALLLTILLTIPWPALLWVLSWRLRVAPTDMVFPSAVGSALYIAAVVLAMICMQINICRKGGLAEVHFHWTSELNAILCKRLRILAAIIVPMVFLVMLANQQSQIIAVSALGRLLLIVALLTLTIFSALEYRPQGPLGKHWYRDKEGLLYRMRYIWYALTVILPVSLMVLTWIGYYSLALQLTWEMTITSWFIIGLLLAYGLMVRWLTVLFYAFTTRRHRRTKTAQDDAVQDVDVTALREQTRRVLRFVIAAVLVLGLWGIWADSLPTLRLVGRVPLWNTSKSVSVETINKDGLRNWETEERIEPVTLGDAAIAVLVIGITIAASRSASGILRFVILRRLTMDKGAKYALTVLVRYTIGVVGVIISLSMLGLRWDSIQWLVAAMTVGLGFGLQEIFANFISGLIILFERPIRVGDTVTVGDTVGTVTKLRIRATTITDWDCKELIVPNREFITNRLVNWTLSDKILRVVLRVGVAYGSDTELVEKLLYTAAQSHSLVLQTPKPVVLFHDFGDNSLNFELRVYIRGIESFLPVKHEINLAIDKSFREHNICIAFPQRDMHLDTNSPLDIRILPAEDQPRPKSRK